MTITKAKPITVTRSLCEGYGSYDTQHPQWGSRTCPEAYVNVTCDECDGTGRVSYDRGELLSTLAGILNTHGEEADVEDVAESIIARLEYLGLVPEEKR